MKSAHEMLETHRQFYIESLSSHIPQGVWTDEDMRLFDFEPMTYYEAHSTHEMFVKENWLKEDVKI